jgi:SAM-dependent methyltransferase
MQKVLAKYEEITATRWTDFMSELNSVARRGGLAEYQTYSRIWEYPWLWFQLENAPTTLSVLDVGSERSAFPWLLASKGFDVTVSDVTAKYWDLWKSAQQSLDVKPRLRILDTQDLSLPTSTVDVYQSVSILEHVADKAKALAEAARVLRPGGLLLMTFDICEGETGMTFPEWNGRAVSMAELDQLFESNRWFESGVSKAAWNLESISDYWAWHRSTAPHHNYVTGALAIRRTQERWTAPANSTRFRNVYSGVAPELQWHMQGTNLRMKRLIPRPIRSLLKAGRSWLKATTE